MTISPASLEADLANGQPAPTTVLEPHRVDHRCGGRNRLDPACADLRVAPTVVADLAARVVDRQGSRQLSSGLPPEAITAACTGGR